jgi:hypothetical protein
MHDIEEKVGGWMDGYVEPFSSLDTPSCHLTDVIFGILYLPSTNGLYTLGLMFTKT